MGQGWGPEGWPGGGTGSGRRRLGAAEPAAVPARDCPGIPLEPGEGSPGAQRTLPPTVLPRRSRPGGLRAARGEGQPRGWQEVDGTDLGMVGKGQDWDSPCSLCQLGRGL